MTREEQLQRLLRLKRYEQPPEGFAEEFLEDFQRRQRTELMHRSATGILWERILAWLDGLRRPVVIFSAAGVYAAVLLTLWLVPRPEPQTGVTMLVGTENISAPVVNYQPVASRGTGTVSHVQVNAPGKRRTSEQSQDKESVIGPEQSNREPEDRTPEVPLRDL